MEGVISVIVPVYNVETYLGECLDSILNQDYDKLEVILIDDGSKDSSGSICDAYAARDSRVRVIHQKNGGAAAAKNAGLRGATGEYLSFVDSDDYLEPNAYGYMVEVLRSQKADAVQFAFREVWKTGAEDRVIYKGRDAVDSGEYLRRLTKDYSCALLWNKLYRRSIYDGIFFEEGHKIDDEYFTYRGFLQDRKIVFDDRIIYNYRKRASSVMSSPAVARQRLMDRLDCITKRRETVLACRPGLRKILDETYLDALWYLSEEAGNTEESLKQIKLQLKDYLRTPGNSLPPRYLWKRLWKLYRAEPEELLKHCPEPAAQDISEFFA